MRTFVLFMVGCLMVVGCIVLAAWGENACTSRGGHFVAVIPGKIYKCEGAK